MKKGVWCRWIGREREKLKRGRERVRERERKVVVYNYIYRSMYMRMCVFMYNIICLYMKKPQSVCKGML